MHPLKSDNSGEWPVTRILVVDDDVELCELVEQYLQSQGFQIDAVHDGSAGIERALSGVYSLVILDVMLPGIRGFEVLRQIRAKSAIPVIMLTAHGDLTVFLRRPISATFLCLCAVLILAQLYFRLGRKRPIVEAPQDAVAFE